MFSLYKKPFLRENILQKPKIFQLGGFPYLNNSKLCLPYDNSVLLFIGPDDPELHVYHKIRQGF